MSPLVVIVIRTTTAFTLTRLYSAREGHISDLSKLTILFKQICKIRFKRTCDKLRRRKVNLRSKNEEEKHCVNVCVFFCVTLPLIWSVGFVISVIQKPEKRKFRPRTDVKAFYQRAQKENKSDMSSLECLVQQCPRVFVCSGVEADWWDCTWWVVPAVSIGVLWLCKNTRGHLVSPDRRLLLFSSKWNIGAAARRA